MVGVLVVGGCSRQAPEPRYNGLHGPEYKAHIKVIGRCHLMQVK